MCGRFTLTTAADVIADVFGVDPPSELCPRYNIAPTQTAAVVRSASSRRGRRMDQLRWGLIPFWAKDAAIGNRMINARAETVAAKPAYRAAFKKRRCLVPADGFYEWRKMKTAKTKQPFWIHRVDGAPFAFAGLWESWNEPGGSDNDRNVVESFTIITTTPNAIMKPIHDRMPVILPRETWDSWLAPEESDPAALLGLLVPCAADDLETVEIGTHVNNPRNDDPRCLEPARPLGPPSPPT